MTAAAPARARPVRPARSLFVPLAVVGFMVVSWWSLSSEFGIGFDLGELIENITRGARILYRDNPINPADRGLLNPNWAFLASTVEPMIETFQMAVIAAVVGCGLALPISFVASRVTAPGRATLFGVRGVLSVVRAIPDILYALVFVAAVGLLVAYWGDRLLVRLVSGNATSTPVCSMGVTTMKMISSTRQTSTSGVTLMFALTS